MNIYVGCISISLKNSGPDNSKEKVLDTGGALKNHGRLAIRYNTNAL
jgi:hypothetical protein